MKKFRGAFIKNEREIALMREANRIVAHILDVIGDEVRPGIATRIFDTITRDICLQHRVKPAFLGMYGFPHALCCSVNEVVVHGFPSERVLQEGDIVSCDVGVRYEGFYGDAARTYAVGQVSVATQRLLRITEDALYAGIGVAQAGTDVYEIGGVVQKMVEAAGFNVVRRFVGHGVGTNLHEKPEVPNFRPVLPGMPLQNGMVIAIEPMVSAGVFEVDILQDKWTAVTRDRSLAAHFEHSVVITPHGPEILSLSNRTAAPVPQCTILD